MKKKEYLTLLLLMLGTIAWGETKTEGFEHATPSTTYNQRKTISENSSDCGIGWEIYFGSATTTSPISGKQSVQLRYYGNTPSSYGNIHTTTAIEGLTNVSFKAKVSNENLLINISYSADGSNWIYLETRKKLTTTVTTYSVDIPSGGKYFRLSISSGSDSPGSSNNYQFIVDDVVFTYNNLQPSYSFIAESNNTAYGTVSKSGNVITATPADGYQVSTTNPYTIDPAGAANVTNNGDNTFTVSDITANCTITINFVAATKLYIHTKQADWIPYIWAWLEGTTDVDVWGHVWNDRPQTTETETVNGILWHTITVPSDNFYLKLNNGYSGDNNETPPIHIQEDTYICYNLDGESGIYSNNYMLVSFADITAQDISVLVGRRGQSSITNNSGVLTTYSFESDNPGVATVDASGVVTGVASGTATITVSWPTTGTINSNESTGIVGGSTTFTVSVGQLRAYRKITDPADIQEGMKYLIVNESYHTAFNGSLTTLDANGNGVPVTIKNNKIITEDDIYFTINRNGDDYTIQSKSGYYIGHTGSSNGLNASETTAYPHSIDIDGGDANIICNNYSLQYNKTSGQERFRYYENENNSQEPIQLYKEIDPEVKIYVKADQAPYIYTWTGDGASATEYTGTWPGTQAPTQPVEENGVTWYTMTVPALGFNLILNNGNSGKINQTDDIEDIREDTYYVWNSSDDGYAANQYLAVDFAEVSASDLTVSIGKTVASRVTTTPEGLSLSYSSSDGTIAAVTANGKVTGISTGDATITVSWATQVVDGQGYVGGSISYTVTVNTTLATDYFVKARTTGELHDGMGVIIVHEDAGNDRVMGEERSNNNNFGGSPVTINRNATPFKATPVTGEVVTILALEQTDDFWYFRDENGKYLYAASSSSNHLKTEEEADDNAKASITIGNDDNNNNATITFQGSNTRNIIRYNPNSGGNIDLFSCYSSGSSVNGPIQIYYREGVILNEIANNQPVLDDNEGSRTVNLYRQLTAEMWNAICLPFDVNEANMKKLFGEDYLLRSFSGVEKNGNSVTLMFSEETTIQAGVPYIVLPKKSVNRDAMVAFANVTLTKTAPEGVTKKDTDGNTYTFQGIYEPTSFTANDKSIRFLGSGNKFYYPSNTKPMRAFRCYFQLPTEVAAKLSNLDMALDDGMGVATGIIAIGTDVSPLEQAAGHIYSVSGQYVGTKAEGLPKGLYIRDGKKFVVK